MAQHKRDNTLGHKVLTSVSIFVGDELLGVEDFYMSNPNLLWEVKDAATSGLTEASVQSVVDEWKGKNPLPNIAFPEVVDSAHVAGPAHQAGSAHGNWV